MSVVVVNLNSCIHLLHIHISFYQALLTVALSQNKFNLDHLTMMKMKMLAVLQKLGIRVDTSNLREFPP